MAAPVRRGAPDDRAGPGDVEGLPGLTIDPDGQKRAAARAAADGVRDGMVLGLGTGSTIAHFLERLGERIEAGELGDVAGVPTSIRTADSARRLGIPTLTLEEAPLLDLAVDGADEFDPDLDLIKGLGGALLREKVVAQSARRLVIVVDESKRVERLGSRAPLPVEVVPFARAAVQRFLESGADAPRQTTVRRDEGGDVYVTDNGNHIVDVRFADGIDDKTGLDTDMKSRAGVVETGLFLGLADAVFVGTDGGVETLERTS